MADELFYGITIGSILGFICFTISSGMYYILAAIFVCLMCILFVGHLKNHALVFSFSILVSLILGYSIAYVRTPTLPALYSSNIGQKVVLQGKVISADNKNNIETILIQPGGVRFRVLAKVPNGKVKVGEGVTINGTLVYPENFTGSDGMEFDYVSYLKKDKVYVTLDKPYVQSSTPASKWNIVARLALWREKIEDQVNANLHEPQSGLARGVLIGSRDWLTPQLRDAFVRSGTIHIIALSGYNITIVVEAMLATLGVLFSVTVSWVAAIVGIILFVILTGASSTAIRAGIMGGIVILAKLSGRKPYIGRVLMLTILIMGIMNPFTILYDISFQLSIVATIGLIYITPKILSKFFWITEKLALREIVASTIATNLAVLPLILYAMGQMSIVSIPANVLILPLMPIAMFLGCMVVLCMVVPKISILVAFPLSLLLSFMLWVIALFASIPFGVLDYHMPVGIMIGLYGIMGVWLFGKNVKEMLTIRNLTIKK